MAISPRNPNLGQPDPTQPLHSTTGGWAIGNCAQPPQWNENGDTTETESVWGAATVSAANQTNPSVPALQGGFQLTATTSGATRNDHATT